MPLKDENAVYILVRESKLLIAESLNCANTYLLSQATATVSAQAQQFYSALFLLKIFFH